MSTKTEFEAWVRSQLSAAAEPVTPRPDPYGRLLRRRRAGWLRRWLVAAVTALAVAGATTVTTLSPAGSPPSPPSPPAGQEWVDALVESPARGALAADPLFARDMTEWVTNIVRSAQYHPATVAIDGLMHPEQEVRLIFADDIDDHRLVALALRLAQAPDPAKPLVTGPGRTRVLWLLGPSGSPPSDLASAVTDHPVPGVVAGAANGAPFTILPFGEPSGPIEMGTDARARAAADIVWVGLAPPGCTVWATTDADRRDFTPEPTGSYIVRTPATYRAEFWRVTCQGVLREERAGPWPTFASADPQVVASLRNDLQAGGFTDPAYSNVALQVAQNIAWSLGPFRSGEPLLLYAGSPDGLPVAATERARTTIVVAVAIPTTLSTWVVEIAVYSEADNVAGLDVMFTDLDAGPPAPDTTLAVSHLTVVSGAAPRPGSRGTSSPTTQVIAIVDPRASTADLVAPDGTVIGTSAVVSRLAAFDVPVAYTRLTEPYDVRVPTEGLRVVFRDSSGSTLSTTQVQESSFVAPAVTAVTADWG